MSPSRRFLRGIVRESFFLAIAGLGSWLFLNHQILYRDRSVQPNASPLEAYLVTALVLYLFIRVIVLVAQIRVPAVRGGVEVCPECGHVLDDGTPEGVWVQDRVAHPRAPPQGAATAATDFRRAFDRARDASSLEAAPRAESPSTALAGDAPWRVENPPVALPEATDRLPFPVVRPVRRLVQPASEPGPPRPSHSDRS